MWQPRLTLRPCQPSRTIPSLSWLISGLVGAVVLALPAEAARLQYWQFDTQQNRLQFTTDEGVQPRAQLIADPTRIVIDLPGTFLGRPKVSQSLGSVIRTMRIAQFDQQTTRIVIELAPGYSLDPQQVKIQGDTPTQWSVQLPEPQPIAAATTIPNSNSGTTRSGSATPPQPSTTRSQPSTTTAATAKTEVDDIRVTPDGLFISTRGTKPKVSVKRSRNRQEINVELKGAGLVTALADQTYPLNRHGITQLKTQQISADPPVARISLNVSRNQPDWQASVSNFGGVVLLPKGGAAAIANSNRPNSSLSLLQSTTASATTARSSSLATIQGVDLGGTQLLIRADRPLAFTTAWEGNAYRVTIRSAQFAEQIQGPRLASGSPLSQVRLRQDDDQTVSILATPANGIRIGPLSRPNAESLVVALVRPGAAIAVPPPTNALPPTAPTSQIPLPTLNSRRIVVVDPGHGGPDVGAVGINGLRETTITLAMGLEVARLLQQQGVQVYLTRTDERDVDLPPRVALAERVNATVFVSIHANAISMSRPDVNGLETYHSRGSTEGNRLAQYVHNSILQNINVRDRGVRGAGFYVIKNTSMPSILVETGFVTGAEDAPRLADPNYRNQMAAAIVRGILQYLQART